MEWTPEDVRNLIDHSQNIKVVLLIATNGDTLQGQALATGDSRPWLKRALGRMRVARFYGQKSPKKLPSIPK